MAGQGQQGKSTQQHISNDFVPTTMVKGHGSMKESEDQLARLIGITNDTFKEMGVTTTYGKKTAGPQKSPGCAGCGREVVGRVINALDSAWHPACFQCSQCCKPIELGGGSGGSFIVRNNKAWCTKCDEWDKKNQKEKKASANSGGNTGAGNNGNNSGAGSSSSSSASVADKNAAIAKKNKEQADAHDAIQAGKEHCAACNKAILGEAVEYNRGTVTQFFHVACFQCAHCRKSVDNVVEGFNHYKGKIYHPACYKQIIGHGGCAGCGQNITTKYVLPEGANGPKYHSACFVCCVPSCKKELAGSAGFLIRDGNAYCAGCAEARFSSNTTVHTSKHTGFKVDPMTHKKVATPAYTGVGPTTTTTTKTTTTAGVSTTTTTTSGGGAKKFCTQCGTPSQGGKFCSSCGHAL